MDTVDMDDDDEEEIEFHLGQDADSTTPPREIKPLRKPRTTSELVDPFAFTAQAMADGMDICVGN